MRHSPSFPIFLQIQMKSDGTIFTATGSADGPSCQATDSVCTLASDLSAVQTCSGTPGFTLPALGRVYPGTEHPDSLYPGGAANTVTLSDSGVDDVYFGPSTPTV
jgi:hypothetical protein